MARGGRLGLLVVDLTRAFVDGRYPLAAPRTSGACVQATRRLLHACRAAGVPVLFSRGDDVHNAAERGRWKVARLAEPPGLPPRNEIVAEVAPLPNESVIRKRRPSAFHGTELVGLLVHERVETLIVCGMTTSGCVRATVVDAFSHNFDVVVPHECVADRVHVSHAVALFDIHAKYADVVALDDVLGLVDGAG
jgi:nicotinamidase-related amidase